MHSPMSVAMLQCSTVGVKRTCGAVRPQTLVLLHSFCTRPTAAKPHQSGAASGLADLAMTALLAQPNLPAVRSSPPTSALPKLHRTCTVPAASSTSTCSSVTTFSCSRV